MWLLSHVTGSFLESVVGIWSEAWISFAKVKTVINILQFIQYINIK